jgi:hypothetical protein
MQRRLFMGLLSGAGAALGGFAAPSSSEPNRTRFYAVETFYLKNGTQPARIHEHFSKVAIPAIRERHDGPVIALEALVAPHMPQVAIIIGFRSLEQMWTLHTALGKSKDFSRKYQQWQAGPEPPFESQSKSLLEAADYSPDLENDKAPRKARRVFELRQYHSPTWAQLQALHERFAGPEIKIFHRCGIHPVFYTSTLIGSNMPNLTYLIPFESLDAREKAWNAFAADPEWIQIRKESIDRHGQISSVIQISLYQATPYSPVG